MHSRHSRLRLGGGAIEFGTTGVESAEGLEVLKHLGCDMAQGYYFSRRLPHPELLAWMTESRWSSGAG